MRCDAIVYRSSFHSPSNREKRIGNANTVRDFIEKKNSHIYTSESVCRLLLRKDSEGQHVLNGRQKIQIKPEAAAQCTTLKSPLLNAVQQTNKRETIHFHCRKL